MKKKLQLGIIIGAMMLGLTGCCVFHEWKEADCTNPKTCIKCEKTKGEALGHILLEATCTSPQICSVCGEAEGKALGHTLSEATCIEAPICSVCGETEGEALGHAWVEATCTEAKTCSTCGETEGEALGHNWIEATCLNPKTCDRCSITEGNITEHNWVDATCQVPITCSVCGVTDGRALEHQMDEGGVCELCNQQIAIPLTLDNIDDYFYWKCEDLTKKKEGYITSKIPMGLELSFLGYCASSDKSINYSIKDFVLTFDVTIDYRNVAGVPDEEYYQFTVKQSDLKREIGGYYKDTAYYTLDSDAIGVYKTVGGTVVNYYYNSEIELQSVSGYIIIED